MAEGTTHKDYTLVMVPFSTTAYFLARSTHIKYIHIPKISVPARATTSCTTILSHFSSDQLTAHLCGFIAIQISLWFVLAIISRLRYIWLLTELCMLSK